MNLFGFWRKRKIKPEPEPVPGDYRIHAWVQTDIGCTRQENQDYGVVVRNEAAVSRGLLVAVADGMGGHKGGQVASRSAVEALVEAYNKGVGEPQIDLRLALEQANSAVFQRSRENEELQGMGTTCTALVLLDGLAYCAHVGDSRIYLIRDGQMRQMSEDHSAVMQLVREGIITIEEARYHADKNVITRAVGSRPEVEVFTWNEPFPVVAGDRFVVCSDGLYGRMEDSEILVLASASNPKDACAALVQLAKERGGYDNITVAIVYLG